MLKTYDAQGAEQPLDFPEASNVLQWYTEDGTKVSVRPSGTEPKIKFYIEVKSQMSCAADYPAARAQAQEKITAVAESPGL